MVLVNFLVVLVNIVLVFPVVLVNFLVLGILKLMILIIVVLVIPNPDKILISDDPTGLSYPHLLAMLKITGYTYCTRLSILQDIIPGAKVGDWRERYYNMNKLNSYDNYCCLEYADFECNDGDEDDDDGNVGDGKG